MMFQREPVLLALEDQPQEHLQCEQKDIQKKSPSWSNSRSRGSSQVVDYLSSESWVDGEANK